LISADENYPALLREIYDPPLVLYVKGELTAKDKNAVAMVGSRQTTHYGIETARKLRESTRLRRRDGGERRRTWH
jgi:DNA processing protein